MSSSNLKGGDSSLPELDDDYNPLLDEDEDDDETMPLISLADEDFESLDQAIQNRAGSSDKTALPSLDSTDVVDEDELPSLGLTSNLPDFLTEIADEEEDEDDEESLWRQQHDKNGGSRKDKTASVSAQDQGKKDAKFMFSGDFDELDDDNPLGGFNLDEVLSLGFERGASDVHLYGDKELRFTIQNDIVRVPEYGVIPGDLTNRLTMPANHVISHVIRQQFTDDWELDTSYVLRSGEHKGSRTRLSVGKSEGQPFLVFRLIKNELPSLDQIGVPAVMRSWTHEENGLVMVCGPTGTGKSTTFGSLIREIQLSKPKKIITLEKPIEYMYPDDGVGFVVQREIGRDSRSFSNGLTSAMRQKPDIIMVGEVRNHEEIQELIRASETGHLSFTTIHASSPAVAIKRISSMFDGEERLQVLGSLEESFRGLSSQVLCKRRDGKGMKAVIEVLDVNREVAAMIGRGDSTAIAKYQHENRASLNHALVEVVKSGVVTLEEARSKSHDKRTFDEIMIASD